MLEWKDVLHSVVSTLGNHEQSVNCILEFLRILAEEVTEGRKIDLTVCGAEPSPLERYIPTTSTAKIRF